MMHIIKQYRSYFTNRLSSMQKIRIVLLRKIIVDASSIDCSISEVSAVIFGCCGSVKLY